MEQYIWLDESPEESGDEQQNGNQSGEDEPDISWLTVDFEVLNEINPDIVVWIYIEDIKINYSVVQGRNILD